MNIPLSTLAVPFAAFCVWLTVRIMNRREQWPKWLLGAVVGLPVLYVLSLGPVYSLGMKNYGDLPDSMLVVWEWYLSPLQWAVDSNQVWLYGPIMSYVSLWYEF